MIKCLRCVHCVVVDNETGYCNKLGITPLYLYKPHKCQHFMTLESWVHQRTAKGVKKHATE